MSFDPGFSALVVPKARRRKGRAWWIAAVIAGVLGLSGAVALGYRPGRFGSRPPVDLATVTVDRGDVTLIVTESGVLESTYDSVVRCEVESFLGLPVATAKGPPSDGTVPRLSGTGGSSVMKPSSAAAGAQTGTAAKVRSLLGGGAAASAGGGRATAAASVPASAAATPEAGIAQKPPTIRSFAYVVAPHVALRANAPEPVIRTGAPPGRRRSSRFSPRGQCPGRRRRVRARFLGLPPRVPGAEGALRADEGVGRAGPEPLAVNEIALQEYEEGIFPQDMELVKRYIGTRESIREQAVRNLAWSRMAMAKGFRSPRQVEADAGALLDAEIRLRDARGMLERLVNYTAKRIIEAQKAKIEAIRADMLSLESSFELESERLKRIEAMIAHCTMRAPRDGIVVYANRSNLLGMVESQIREGLIVYQSQPIFRMLDATAMQVKARINESQVARLRSGQPALIRLDAFPDRPMRGTVAEITAIPAPLNAIASDVHAYLATVRIEAGVFDELRNGLSAAVEILVETRRNVPRVPLGAIRWAGGRSFAAVLNNAPSGPTWKWRPVMLGVSDTRFAEVLSGLEPGNRVIAHPELLPGPKQPLITEQGRTRSPTSGEKRLPRQSRIAGRP